MDLSSLSLEKAAEHLAVRQAVASRLLPSEKRAAIDWSQLGKQVQEFGGNLLRGNRAGASAAENLGWESGRNALLGAGAGGLLGAGRSLLSDEPRKDYLGDILQGATLGGVAGGGGTLAYRGLMGDGSNPGMLTQTSPEELAKRVRDAQDKIKLTQPGTPAHDDAVKQLADASSQLKATGVDPQTVNAEPSVTGAAMRQGDYGKAIVNAPGDATRAITDYASNNPRTTADVAGMAGGGTLGAIAGTKAVDAVQRRMITDGSMQQHVRDLGDAEAVKRYSDNVRALRDAPTGQAAARVAGARLPKPPLPANAPWYQRAMHAVTPAPRGPATAATQHPALNQVAPAAAKNVQHGMMQTPGRRIARGIGGFAGAVGGGMVVPAASDAVSRLLGVEDYQ